jgi:hypothetical protein
VVLALGALGFGVVSQVRVQDLERRVASLEHTAAATSPTVVAPAGDVSGLPTTVVTTTSEVPVVGSAGEALPSSERAGVEAAYTTVYDGSRPTAERLAFVDDTAGVAESLQALASSPMGSQAAAVRAVVDRVTFTSSMTATVTYRLTSGSGGSATSSRIGSARRVGGTWKVTRSTVCDVLADAGAPCAN